MKKTLFAIATFAVLAMSCVKEQQPSTPADSAVVTSLRVSVADTKVSVNEITGACTWQDGDQIAMWFKTGEETSGDKTTDVGVKTIFTYSKSEGDDVAVFTTTDAVPAEYTSVKIAHPVGALSNTGAFSLVRNYEYNANKVPVYLRAETTDVTKDGSAITLAEDGAFNAMLGHNAPILKFTLHDVPAYAAGFVLEWRKTETNKGEMKTLFPYKTGYTSDPADHSNDVVLHSAAAHSSYPYQVYLIDGDGFKIEGSERRFKTTNEFLAPGDYIIMPTLDFKKSELDRDYIMVKGVKWAKGNLRYDASVAEDGFQAGWSLVANQWHYIGYDISSSTVNGTKYTYDSSKATEMRIQRNNSCFEHFNFGGIGKWSYDNTNYAAPLEPKDISGRIYSDQNVSEELTGEARFASEGDDAPQLYGDLAFWASKGKYRMPTTDEMTSIHNQASKIPGWCVVNGYKIWGYLLRTPDLGQDRSSDATVNGNREFTMADLESGMFFPFAGRVAETAPDIIIAQRTQFAYRSSTYVKQNNAKTKYYSVYYFAEGSSAKKYDSWSGSNSSMSAAAGFFIRPVLVD